MLTLEAVVEAAAKLSPDDRLDLLDRIFEMSGADHPPPTLGAAEFEAELDRRETNGEPPVPWGEFQRLSRR